MMIKIVKTIDILSDPTYAVPDTVVTLIWTAEAIFCFLLEVQAIFVVAASTLQQKVILIHTIKITVDHF